MGCNCKWLEIIVAVVVFVLALWPEILGSASKWVLVVAAVVLFLHALMCKNCKNCDSGAKMSAVPVTKKTAKRRRK